MKKLTLTLVAVAVIAVVIAGVLSLNYNNNHSPHIEITNFNTTGTAAGFSEGIVNVWFALNLTNIGTDDAKDLTIAFNTNTTIESGRHFVYTNSTPPYDKIAEFEIGEPFLIDDIKAGETKDFKFYWAVSVDSYASFLTATLKSSEAILDQATVTIPPIPNVKITNFICLGIWHGTRLGGALDLFSLCYTNLGSINADSVTVTLNTSKTNTESTLNSGYNPKVFLDEYINGTTYPLESLNAGETKTFEKTYFEWGAYNSVTPFALTATLKFNEIILDQATVMIPIRTDA